MKVNITHKELWTILAEHYGIAGREHLSIHIQFPKDFEVSLAMNEVPCLYPMDEDLIFVLIGKTNPIQILS